MKQILEVLGIEPVNSGACIGGENFLKTTGDLLSSYNPTTGELIAQVQLASQEDYEKVVQASLQAFLSWRKIPAPQRGLVVRALGDELRKYKKELGALVTLEMGKIIAEGEGEVQEMIDIADFAVGLSRQLYGLTMHSERPNHRMYEQWHPLGICGIISAFNFPVAVWSWNALIAAVCGDISLWKPSPKTPLTAIAVQKICNKVLNDFGYKGIFNLVIGANETVGNALINDKRIPLVSFTGSTAVGRMVGEKVQSRFGKLILELGGNNAVIIDEFANLSLALPAVVFGAVGTAGQRCTSTRRVIIHASKYEEFKGALLNAYQQIRIGDPMDAKTLMGPLIDEMAVQQYQNTIQKAIEQGGKVIHGNEVIKGNFVKPTIIEIGHDAPIVHHETFAPILYLIKVNSLEEAIAVNNEVEQGLSSSIFTDNLQHAELFLSALGSDCGIANVNIGTSGAEIGGAFGGEKATGGGRESGSDAWKGYMRRQTNTINYGKDLPLAQGIKFEL